MRRNIYGIIFLGVPALIVGSILSYSYYNFHYNPTLVTHDQAVTNYKQGRAIATIK